MLAISQLLNSITPTYSSHLFLIGPTFTWIQTCRTGINVSGLLRAPVPWISLVTKLQTMSPDWISLNHCLKSMFVSQHKKLRLHQQSENQICSDEVAKPYPGLFSHRGFVLFLIQVSTFDIQSRLQIFSKISEQLKSLVFLSPSLAAQRHILYMPPEILLIC